MTGIEDAGNDKSADCVIQGLESVNGQQSKVEQKEYQTFKILFPVRDNNWSDYRRVQLFPAEM